MWRQNNYKETIKVMSMLDGYVNDTLYAARFHACSYHCCVENPLISIHLDENFHKAEEP